MPPPDSGSPPPTAEEKAAIAAWNGSGSECNDPNAETCAENPNRCVGEQYLPCQVTQRFLAHAPGNMNAKYPVGPGSADEYTCFDFRNPFYGTQNVVRAEAPVIDNGSVIHHWLLFGTHELRADGAIRGACVAPEMFTTTTWHRPWDRTRAVLLTASSLASMAARWRVS